LTEVAAENISSLLISKVWLETTGKNGARVTDRAEEMGFPLYLQNYCKFYRGKHETIINAFGSV